MELVSKQRQVAHHLGATGDGRGDFVNDVGRLLAQVT